MFQFGSTQYWRSVGTFLILMVFVATAGLAQAQVVGPRIYVHDGPFVRETMAQAVQYPAQVIGNNKIYLPLVTRAPEATITFGVGLDGNDQIIGPATSFAYGLDQLYYRIDLDGAQGQNYTTELFVNGISINRRSGTLPNDDSYQSVYTTSWVCMVTTGSSVCTGDALDHGSYTITVTIGNLVFTKTALIQ